MPYHVSSNYAIFAGTSAQSSLYTSSAYLVGDFAQMSLSVHTKVAVASNHTVWGTNEHGLTSSLVTWSVVTTLTVPGIYNVEPGMRWMRVTRPSLDSLSQVFLTGRT